MTNKSLNPKDQIAAQQLAASVLARQRERGWRVVMIVSTRHGHGRSTLCQSLIGPLQALSEQPWRLINAEQLKALTPEALEDGLWLVDGPALADERSPQALDRALIDRVDAAILVVMTRASRQDEVTSTARWIESLGIELTGVILNDHLEPALGLKFKRLWRRLFKARQSKTNTSANESGDEHELV